MAAVNWKKEIQPLIQKYKGKKHPLEYNNYYELIVAVILSAQDSDRHINKLATEFFSAFPDMKSLSKTTAEGLFPFINEVRNFHDQVLKDGAMPLIIFESKMIQWIAPQKVGTKK